MGTTLQDFNSSNVFGQQTYSVFTGTDIYTMFKDMIISNMQGLSYSVTRQKAPIYTMGSPDLRAIARSKRGIAGSMIMTTFDRHALAGFMTGSTFAGKKGSIEQTGINPYNGNTGTTPGTTNATGSSILPTTPGGSIQTTAPVALNAQSQQINSLTAGGSETSDLMSQIANPMFTDQLLPFDTTLMAANEYGIGSAMRILGMEILNEGSGVSIDDTSNEVQMTYLCRLITPWVPQKLNVV